MDKRGGCEDASAFAGIGSTLESGKLELKMERVCLKDAWTRIESTVQSHAIAKGIELKFLQSDDTNWFRVDVAAVSQILVNLIANAIKFTPNGGTVEVGEEAACRSGHLSFFVRDNGRGIPANKVKDVQKPFVQVSDSYVRDVGGVGLGLAICKSLAGAMSGRLRISSKLGKGTKVQVTFQRFDAAHEAPQAEAPARPARNA